MGGVTFSYTELTGDNYKLLILDDVNGEGYTFKVSPYAGYFFRDNMAAGVLSLSGGGGRQIRGAATGKRHQALDAGAKAAAADGTKDIYKRTRTRNA